MRGLILLVALCFGMSALAQDQMLVRVNHSGLVQLMRMSLQYNQAGDGKPGFKIPAGIYSFKVKREDLQKNPIIQILNEISDINLTKDFPFYVTNSLIDVTGSINESSLRTKVSNYTKDGFDLKVSFNVEQLKLKVSDISICDTKNGSRCGKGLKASFKNVSIGLRNQNKIALVANFRISMDSKVARMKLLNVSSNLDNGPKLDINIGSVVVPPVTIAVNGQEFQLDTSGLRDEILQRREFLAQKLLAFASEFIAEDLAEMVNKTLKNQCLPTTLRVIELGNEDRPAPSGGYTSVPVAIGTISPYRGDNKEQPSMMELLQRDLAAIIKSASFDVSVKSVRSPVDQDLELRLNGALRMNRLSWTMRSTVGNSTRQLPALNIDQTINRNEHVAVVIGEPVLNSSLDLLSSVGVFQQLISKQPNMSGVYISSVKAHFKSGATPTQDRYYVIANIRVNLRETPADGGWAWIKRFIAVWLERNNNNANLYFPIQLEIIPRLAKGADGKLQMMLRVNSPFASATALRNDFKYYNNITNATSTVRSTVLDLLKEGLGDFVNKEFQFPIDEYLSRKGLTIEPKSIRLIDSAYMMVSANITKLDLRELNSDDKAEAGSCH